MKITYYPGCTLKTRAQSMDEAARACLSALGVELVEPKRWTCCGVLHPLSDDGAMGLLGPVRNLIRIKEEGSRRLVTICSMCYNSLARANILMNRESEKKSTINRFFEEHEDYNGEVEVVHLLTLLRDEVGWDAVRERVESSLGGLRLAPYYGCGLLRPLELSIENTLRPGILGEFLECLGATAVDFSAACQCCGSYQTVSHPDIATQVAARVTDAAKTAGAAAIVTSCPLCDHNLKKGQRDSQATEGGDKSAMPTFYFTELMAVAFGLDIGDSLSQDQRELCRSALKNTTR